MSLLKPRTLSPAQLAANRANALKSKGPTTARGKAQSRLNALRTGRHSPTYLKLFDLLLDAPPGAICRTALAALTPQEAHHPRYTSLVEIFHQADLAAGHSFVHSLGKFDARQKKTPKKIPIKAAK